MVFTNTCLRIYEKNYKTRRAKGMVVDGEFLKTKMKFEIQKSAKDPEGKFMASCHWLLNFTRQKGI